MFIKLEVIILFLWYKWKFAKRGYAVMKPFMLEANMKQSRADVSLKKADHHVVKITNEIDRVTRALEVKNPCIYNSAIGYLMLRRRNYNVIIKTGVSFPPFNAHAWVEIDGEKYLYGDETVKYTTLCLEEVKS
ncbi:hypothetical protein PA598K_03664 [Paenibacillus sp. 598K]|uniref:lasso peptide biosynthesis B2 protein n=1 Tax=Paenibacillus sp. 598K TaxID=1117987 RepID=UPI000FFAB0D5|nr:lasso peptide biosynthesis B2 protein [Paenibacillus sp. 598K]GBF75272.1 hypothetical protein PA598K_03664 [Paenibacillus sp. 598K]